MKQVSLFLLFLLLALQLKAQQKYTISGTISDAATGETMIGAAVTLKELPGTGVACNAYGYYSLSLPPGRYTLVVSYIGYTRYEKILELKSSQVLNIKLTADTRLLNVVEIKAEKQNTNVTSTEMGVEKMEMKEIKKIPVLFGEQDLIKTLQLSPGVKSLGEGSGGLYVRGGNSSQNLMLLDEATVYNANHLLGFFSTFNSDAIKSSSLYKGTAPAEYGGRVSSVLDVKMNDGNNQQYHVGGGIGLISSRLNLEGPIVKNKSSFLVTARRTYADMFLKLSSDETLNNNKLYFYDLNLKANYQIDDKNRLYISGYFGRDVFNFQDRFGIDWGNATGTLRWNHIWSDKLFSNTSLIYSDYDYRIAVTRDAGDFSITSLIKNWNLKQDFQYYLSQQHTLNFGLNSFYHTITPGQVETDDDMLNFTELEDKHALENALFISDTWKPNALFSMDFGFRMSMFSTLGPGNFYTYENGNITDTAVYQSGEIVKSYLNAEPRINMTYMLSENSSLKGGYSRNSQNLHMISNSTSSTPTDLWITSGLNVKPEISDQLTAGYFHNVKQDQYQLSAEVYYKWMQHLPDLKNGAEIRANEHIEGELLFGKGRAYGLEILLKKKTGRLSGWIGYTLSRTELSIEGINNGDWYPARQDATHDVSVVGMFDLTDRWTVSATWVFNTGNAVTFPSGKYLINGNVQYYYTERNGYRMPDYHRLDLGATYTFKKKGRYDSSLSFSLYNVYGRKNAYMIDFEQDPDYPDRTRAVKTYLFTYVPSITYNFKF